MAERFEFVIWQGGDRVASVWGEDRERVLTQARHYAFIYGQDGPVRITEKIGRKHHLISD